MGANGQESNACNVEVSQSADWTYATWNPHHYGLTTRLHGALLTRGLWLQMCHALIIPKLDPWLIGSCLRVQLAMPQVQTRFCVWCHTANWLTLVSFLLRYNMEAKECWTDLVAMHLVFLALAKLLRPWSLRTNWPLYCPW